MFFAALDKPHKNARVTRSALALTMRTALRSRELRGGRWSEVARADWTVPADRMKVRETHVVPLSTGHVPRRGGGAQTFGEIRAG